MLQGVTFWEADGEQPGILQPELNRCFRSIESYLDIDLPQLSEPEGRVGLITHSVVDGEWDREEPWLQPSLASECHAGSGIHFQHMLLESATRSL